MPQGTLNVKKAATSAGSHKRRAQLAKKRNATKGRRKAYKPKGRKAEEMRGEVATTKAINRKNEALVSSRAMGGSGSAAPFFLSDIKEGGQAELDKQRKSKEKKEGKKNTMDHRLKEQLKELGKRT